MPTLKDIGDPISEFEKMTSRFRLLQDRFVAIAQDYTHYIDAKIEQNEIFTLRDNVLAKLYTARFHFQILIDYHNHIEKTFEQFYKTNPTEFHNRGFKFQSLYDTFTMEIFSLFDSMIYHLCSIFDYVFRLINFIHGKEIAGNPKWNQYKSHKNLKNFGFCSKELIPKLEKLDVEFVYPLIKHRSILIHSNVDNGNLALSFKLGGKDFKANFLTTKLFKANFPNLIKEHSDVDISLKFSSVWLIDKCLKCTTEILFELRDEIVRNKKIEHGHFVLLDANKSIIPISSHSWGERDNY